MTRRLSYLAAARADLLDILRYIARESGSVATAERFTSALRDKCRYLADISATLGRPRPELRPELRSLAFRGYVIFFRYGEDRVEVVNILEGHRDVIGHFGND